MNMNWGDRCGWFNIAIISTVCVWETERQHWWYWSWLSEPQFNISISVPSWTSQLTLLQLTNTSFYFISTHQPPTNQSSEFSNVSQYQPIRSKQLSWVKHLHISKFNQLHLSTFKFLSNVNLIENVDWKHQPKPGRQRLLWENIFRCLLFKQIRFVRQHSQC